MNRLIVQLRAETRSQAAEGKWRRTLDGLGVRLTPMHPDVADPDLASWFHGEVAAGRDVAGVVRSLTALPQVLAAYLKPPDGLP